MAPKQDQVYARGRSKSVAPSARLVICYDDKHDPEYVPTETATPARAGEPGVDSKLSASSDEADSAAVAGAGILADMEASSDHKTPKE